MLVTVTTLQDRIDNVERFVTRNLASGVDHLVVVLDAPAAPGQADVATLLDEHPGATCIRGDRTWWRGRRPRKLNRRQHANANAVKHALSGCAWATWLAHIDGDEVLDADPAVLAGLDRGVSVLRFEVLEIATDGTSPGDDDVHWFKRRLDRPELERLVSLGILEQARNPAYFHGHLAGKTAVRLAAPVWLSCHDVLDATGAKIPGLTHPGLRVLHLESADVREFGRKWRALLASPVPPSLRPERSRLAAAIHELTRLDLDDASRERALRALFDRHRADDVRRLRELGLLVPVRWAVPAREPALSPQQRADLAAALEQLPALGVAEFARR